MPQASPRPLLSLACGLTLAGCNAGSIGIGSGTDRMSGDHRRAASDDRRAGDDHPPADPITPGDSGHGADARAPADDSSPGDPGGPLSDQVHFIGRFDTRDSTGPRFAWTYSGFWTRLEGTALDLTLAGSTNIRFRVVVDGSVTTTFKTDGTTELIHVAAGLANGLHDVEVYRDSEASWGDSQFIAFAPVGGGTLVTSAPKSSRRLQVVGDSITAGYGNEGCPFSTDTQNGYLTYGARAARTLAVEPHIIAWSGIGMYRNYDGATTNTMPDRYELALAYDATATWDHAQFVPDAIVVNLGTNDFAKGDPGQNYIDAYVRFLDHLRQLFPNVLVLATDMTGSDFSARLDQVVAAAANPKVKKLTLTVPARNGCDGHPDLAADARMADDLVARLQLELGW